MALLPLTGNGRIDVAHGTHAPVEHHFAFDIFVKHIFDDCFDRRETSAASDENNRLVGFAQKERAEWALEAQDGFFFHLGKGKFTERTAGNVAQMELDGGVIVRRIGHGITAPFAVFKQYVKILPSDKLQPLVGRQLELHDDDIMAGVNNFFYAAGQFFDL